LRVYIALRLIALRLIALRLIALRALNALRIFIRHKALHTTTQRLGAAAVSTNSSAAHGFSISHGKFMRVAAAVAPNRKLSAGIHRIIQLHLLQF
jgi:hypothetical protein